MIAGILPGGFLESALQEKLLMGERMDIAIRDTGPKGRGVFALRSFSSGEVIETCPVILLAARDLKLIDATSLFAYYFGWLDGGAIALGSGSLYNHSDKPNARYEKNYDNKTIAFLAVTTIKPDEEITFRYNTGAAHVQLWFEPL